MKYVLSLLFIASFSFLGSAQTITALLSNTQQLQVTMTMDRSTYFMGEATVRTITIANPTSTPLQVVAPFSRGGECFELYTPNADGSYTPLGHDMCDGATEIYQTTPTTIFAPGEQRTFAVKSSDSSFANPIARGGAPVTPGSYVFSYSYNATKASFSVVQPSLDVASIVQVPSISYTNPTTGITAPMARYVNVFAVRWNGQSYLCASPTVSNSHPVRADTNGNLDDLSPGYTRIATSVNPIVSIAPVADSSGNLTITWVDSNGVQTVTPYPANGGDTVAPVVISYRVFFGSQAFELNTSTRNRLPWQITGIEVAFSKPIANATINSLTGVTATAVAGVGTNTLLWTINPISIGAFSTSLLASGANGISDASGNALGGGTAFLQNFRVLWGDFNDDGVVNSQDGVGVNNARNSAVYNIFADMNGDGVVNISDVQIVAARIGTSLP